MTSVDEAEGGAGFVEEQGLVDADKLPVLHDDTAVDDGGRDVIWARTKDETGDWMGVAEVVTPPRVDADKISQLAWSDPAEASRLSNCNTGVSPHGKDLFEGERIVGRCLFSVNRES